MVACKRPDSCRELSFSGTHLIQDNVNAATNDRGHRAIEGPQIDRKRHGVAILVRSKKCLANHPVKHASQADTNRPR